MNEINPTSEIEKSIATLTQGNELITCHTRAEYETLIYQDDIAAGFEKQVAEYWDGSKEKPGPVSKAYSLWKDLTSKRKAMLDPLKAFRSAVSGVTGPFLQAEQRKEQERLDALVSQADEMRRKQEAELAKQAEKLRKEQEAEAKRLADHAEVLRKQQAALAAAQAEKFKNSPAEKARQAAIFKQQQEEAKAEAARQAEELRQEQAEDQERLAREAQARMIDTSLIPTVADKASAGDGRAMFQKWVFDVKDEKLIPREYFVLDTSAVQKVVSALKDKCRIPGIVVRMEASVRRTGRLEK